EDSDISDSETKEYEEKIYEEMKNGKHMVRVSDEAFSCPFCSKKRKRDFQYKDLLQHASAIGTQGSQKRSSLEKASHLALLKYLQNEIAADNGAPKPSLETDALADQDREEMFVWPWIGIIVNIPTEFKDGRFVGNSGSKLRDQLASKGFNPIRVRPLWNYQGHSGTATVEFRKDWSGFGNAMAFEKEYEANHHGKKDWIAKDEKKSDLYAWAARADDYNSNSIIGEHLRKIGDLRTVSDIMEEESRKTNQLVGNLTNVIEAKKMCIQEMENKFQETETSLSELVSEKDKLHQAYNEEMKRIEASARDHFKKIFSDHEKMKFQLEAQKKDLELRGQELQKREAHNEIEKKRLSEDLEQNAVENCSLQAAAEEERKANETAMSLAEKHKKEQEVLHTKIIDLEKKLDAKQALELELAQLRGKAEVMKHMEDGGNVEVLKQVDELQKQLREKEQDLEIADASYQDLVVHDFKKNTELQEARKELVAKYVTANSHIGRKKMGDLDYKPFHESMKRKYSGAEAEEKATELHKLWEEYLRDPGWHPFNVVLVDGKEQRVFKEGDEKLRELRDHYDEDIYTAVVTCLREINENNASGGYVVSVLWNDRENREASLSEGIEVLVNHWKELKQQK
ncbi:hypothetical protein M569_13419, partial [Genlisea aurea]